MLSDRSLMRPPACFSPRLGPLRHLARRPVDNLKDAIKGENYETTTMYREFAEQAEKAGDHAVAMQFEEIRQDEMKHRDAFTAALAKLETTGPTK
jgi:rubrerythrin